MFRCPVPQDNRTPQALAPQPSAGRQALPAALALVRQATRQALQERVRAQLDLARLDLAQVPTPQPPASRGPTRPSQERILKPYRRAIRRPSWAAASSGSAVRSINLP